MTVTAIHLTPEAFVALDRLPSYIVRNRFVAAVLDIPRVDLKESTAYRKPTTQQVRERSRRVLEAIDQMELPI